MESKTITAEDINNMDKIFRLNLINAIPGYKSANLIGTTDQAQHHNLAVFSSVIHLGSNPPLLGMVVRPTTVPRHTYQNIIDTHYYTINHISNSMIGQAHQTSAKYPREDSEFDQTGLTPAFIGDFIAPYVQESTVKIGMRFIEEIDIVANGTKLIVGSIQEIHLPEDAILEDGALDLQACETVAISGLDTYCATDKLSRFGYARP